MRTLPYLTSSGAAGQDPQRSSRTPESEPPKEKRSDDL
jgi:hypothetical protein